MVLPAHQVPGLLDLPKAQSAGSPSGDHSDRNLMMVSVGFFFLRDMTNIYTASPSIKNSDQEHHPFVRLVPFRTTVKLVSLKWTNPPFL